MAEHFFIKLLSVDFVEVALSHVIIIDIILALELAIAQGQYARKE